MTEPIIHFRAFPAQLQQSGPEELTGRLVPYDVPADVLDELPDGRLDLYREGFRRGAFDGQLVNGATNRKIFTKIGLIHRHEGGLGYLGPFTNLREAPDGLWGDVMIMPSLAGNVAALLRAGVDELSVEFRLRPGENTVEQDGVRWRTKVHLDRVALEPKGAYSSARVLAYREEVDELARAEAEATVSAKAEEERLAGEAAAAEAVAAEAAETRRRWDAMVDRLEGEREKQRQLIRDYGITQPSGMGSVR